MNRLNNALKQRDAAREEALLQAEKLSKLQVLCLLAQQQPELRALLRALELRWCEHWSFLRPACCCTVCASCAEKPHADAHMPPACRRTSSLARWCQGVLLVGLCSSRLSSRCRLGRHRHRQLRSPRQTASKVLLPADPAMPAHPLLSYLQLQCEAVSDPVLLPPATCFCHLASKCAGILEQGMGLLEKAGSGMGRYMNAVYQPLEANGTVSYAQAAAVGTGRTPGAGLASPGVAVSR